MDRHFLFVVVLRFVRLTAHLLEMSYFTTEERLDISDGAKRVSQVLVEWFDLWFFFKNPALHIKHFKILKNVFQATNVVSWFKEIRVLDCGSGVCYKW